MTDIKVRPLDFAFDDQIAFRWNPGNDDWGNFVNVMTMIVPAFERYIIRSSRAAIPRMKNTAVAEAADLYCKQEAQHSKQHIDHIKVLTDRYPGLQSVTDEVMASYETLYEAESLDFHLAYAAIAELYLGPLARYVVENRKVLMPAPETRIASFILWHFIEEFEHRNAAIDIYNEVVGSYIYRMRCFPKVMRHLLHIQQLVIDGFVEHVPEQDGGGETFSVTKMTAASPAKQNLALYFGWFCTLLPYHNPDNIPEPDWLKQWHQDDAAGMDMTQYYPQTSA